MNKKTPRYFEKPDNNEAPLSFWKTFLIILSTHLGVRTREQRVDDFKRLHGLHIFIGGIIYFLLIIFCLMLFINQIIL